MQLGGGYCKEKGRNNRHAVHQGYSVTNAGDRSSMMRNLHNPESRASESMEAQSAVNRFEPRSDEDGNTTQGILHEEREDSFPTLQGGSKFEAHEFKHFRDRTGNELPSQIVEAAREEANETI